MVLRRLGRKKKIAPKIIPHFPKHDLYIEPFFGAGGMYFSKPKSKYNYLNDISDEVYNFFQVLIYHEEEFTEKLKSTFIHRSIFKYFQENLFENDIVFRAVRYLYLSNFSYLGKGSTLKFGFDNSKKIALDLIKKTRDQILDVQFNKVDFQDFLKQFSFKKILDRKRAFMYCDPPYQKTMNPYGTPFKFNDLVRLIDTADELCIKYAISEFDTPCVLDLAHQKGLNIIKITNRRNIKNRRTEMLFTNYQKTE